MNYTKELLEKDRVKFTVEVSEEEWKNALTKAYEKNKGKFQIEGFRKGKVPRKVIESMYGVGVFFEDALDIILPETYGEIMDKESDLFPVDRPDIDIAAISDSTLKYTATVQLRPTVTLGAYTGIDFEKQSTEVSDEEVEAEIKKDLENAGSWEPIGDRAVENGDKCVIDFSGSVDGVKFEGGTAKDYTIVLGSGSFIPGFEDQMVGMKAGETKVVKVKFPEDYHAKDLAGKEAIFKVKVHEIKEKQLPELDDDFAKDVDEDVDTLAELKDKTKKELQENKDNQAKAAIEDAAINAAVENAEIQDIPQSMLDEDTNRQMQQYLAGMQQQGISPQMYFQITGTKEDDLKKQFAADAAQRVKTNLVLEAIVDDADLSATEDEIKDEISDLAKQYGMKEDQVKNALSEDMLTHDIKIRKAVDLVADSAKQVEKADDKKEDK